MKNRILIIIGLLLIGYGIGYASETNHASLLKDRDALRKQMVQLLMRVADLDILVNRDHETDYDLFKEDAKGILEILDIIKAMDKEKLFKKELRAVEKPTRKLLHYSEQENPKAANTTADIMNACFRCHAMYRDNRDLAIDGNDRSQTTR